ncbi:MAG TPA: M1 family aminopeptidase [Candidatus Acidoferrales bacterium]|nr:M1 family aminopeptidase [Candidatus Acidoferrales bacterium]
MRKIEFTYDLDPAAQGRGVVAATNDGFYLADPNVFPSWQPPVGPFATGSLRARTEELEVKVPADFHVLAVGNEEHGQRRDEFVLHRFKSRGAQFPPYVVAGRYQERRVNTQRGEVIFWTRQSLAENVARAGAERLAATVATYQNLFGPVMRNPFPIHIVETSAELAPIIVVTPNIAATSFPGGVLLDHRAVALGLATDPVLDLADYELARTWFGWHVRPRPEVDLLLGRGMAIFAGVLAAEARGGIPARQQGIRRLMETYESFGPAADEKTGFGPIVAYTRQQARAQSYKGALFLIELQDTIGKETFYRALRRVLAAMAGQEIGSDEFRSALEQEAGRNLAPVFHAWFDRSGLPAELRARYAATR